MVAGGGDDNLIFASSGGSTRDGVVAECQAIGKSRGGHRGVGVGDHYIVDGSAGAHGLFKIRGTQGNGRVDGQLEGVFLSYTISLCVAGDDDYLVVASIGGSTGDGVFFNG